MTQHTEPQSVTELTGQTVHKRGVHIADLAAVTHVTVEVRASDAEDDSDGAEIKVTAASTDGKAAADAAADAFIQVHQRLDTWIAGDEGDESDS